MHPLELQSGPLGLRQFPVGGRQRLSLYDGLRLRPPPLLQVVVLVGVGGVGGGVEGRGGGHGLVGRDDERLAHLARQLAVVAGGGGRARGLGGGERNVRGGGSSCNAMSPEGSGMIMLHVRLYVSISFIGEVKLIFTIHRLFQAAAFAVSFLLGLVAADVHAGHGLRKVGVGHDEKLVDS